MEKVGTWLCTTIYLPYLLYIGDIGHMEEYVGNKLLGYSPKGTHKFPVKIAYHVYVYYIFIYQKSNK